MNKIVPKAHDGEVLPPAKWRLRGYDTFEGGDAFYDIPGEYDTQDEALAAAQRYSDELKESQDLELRDQIFIIGPNGKVSRFWPADTPEWVFAAYADRRRAGL